MSARRTSPLTRDEIFGKALEIVDAEGTKALSMRHLAAVLGVEAMSLYHHVPNKAALLEGVVNLALSQKAPPVPPASAAWRDVVVGAVLGFWRVLVAHPNVLPLMIENPPTAPEATATYIGGPLQFLVAQGFSDTDASQLFEAVFALSFGHALLSTNYPEIESEGLPTVGFTEASFERGVRVLIDEYAPRA